jgi:hypothetical protein
MFSSRIVILLLISAVTCALAQASNMTIGKEEQQARDKDRHLILRTELAAEHQVLAKAQAAFRLAATAELAIEVRRRMENIKALQRELASAVGEIEPGQPSRLVVKVKQSESPARAQRTSGAATFWNPYNRAPDSEISTHFPTTP